MQLIVPTTYFGNIEYYSVLKDQTVVVDIYENFVKQSFRNRTCIYGANGILNLSVPIGKSVTGSKKIVKDALVNYETNWQKLHWRSIESAYRSSPYFEFYEDQLFPFFEKKEKYLIDLNETIQNQLFQFLDIDTRICLSESYIKETSADIDLREYFSPKGKQNMEHLFVQKYNQVFESKHGFLPNLSILDLLFNEGPNSVTFLQ